MVPEHRTPLPSPCQARSSKARICKETPETRNELLIFPEVRGECEELNNSPQISAVAVSDGRPLTRYAANSRSNGVARSGCRGRHQGGRRREFGDQGWRMREWRLCGQSKSAMCKRGLRNSTGRSATSQQWSVTQAFHKHHGNQRDGSSGLKD